MTAADDPTAAGFIPPAEGTVILSLNEVDALCQKAARGAGFSWGLAEEAGAALRWLSAHGIDGSQALRAHLDLLASVPLETCRPSVTGEGFDCGASGLLCPITLGAALSDRDLQPADTSPVTMGPVHRPILLLPFVAWLARSGGISVEWDEGKVGVSPAGTLNGDVTALAATERAAPKLTPQKSAIISDWDRARPAPMQAETLAALNAYAMRTAVPASAASRTDAGAATDDND